MTFARLFYAKLLTGDDQICLTLGSHIMTDQRI